MLDSSSNGLLHVLKSPHSPLTRRIVVRRLGSCCCVYGVLVAAYRPSYSTLRPTAPSTPLHGLTHLRHHISPSGERGLAAIHKSFQGPLLVPLIRHTLIPFQASTQRIDARRPGSRCPPDTPHTHSPTHTLGLFVLHARVSETLDGIRYVVVF